MKAGYHMILRKKKIYLDTSVISYLRQDDAPERMADTLELWETLKADIYEIFVSDVTVGELARCAEPKRTELFELLEEIRYIEIKTSDNDEIVALSVEIQNQGLLPRKSVNDHLHIAAAMSEGCHVIVSWNFKHLVNIRTIDGIRVIATLNHYNPVDICSPTMLIERSDQDE